MLPLTRSRNRARFFGIPFSPSTLFAGGVAGAWYDPSDYSTLFTDSAGTTPVTGVEQFVGLMLDKSQGLVLGSELVTNGDFSSGTTTGWTTGPNITATVVSGAVNVSRSGGITPINTFGQSTTTIANRWYKISIQIIQNNGAAFSFTDAANASYTGFAPQSFSSGAGVKEFLLYATSTTLRINLWTNDLTTSIFDNISVRELPGNHAFQTSSAKRPKLAARYNLLTYSEEFDNAAWQTTNSGSADPIKTANQGIAPDGTNTADRIDFGAITNATDYSRLFQSFTSVAITYVGSVYLKAFSASDVGKKIFVWLFDSAGRDTQTVTLTDSWQRISSTSALTAGTSFITLQTAGSSVVTGGGAQAATSALVWGADLRPASQATGLIGPTYQRVAAATVYDTAGFLPYLAFDGLDDSMSTNSIDFSAGDKMTVWAGVRKLSDAATAILFESSADSSSNNGVFCAFAPNTPGASNDYSFRSRGTSSANAFQTGFVAPITNVLAGIGDISGDVVTLRVNGTQVATSSSDQGTGNFGNYPLYIGMRNNASLPFTGWLTSLIVRGAQSTQSQIEATEAWVNGKTGAY